MAGPEVELLAAGQHALKLHGRGQAGHLRLPSSLAQSEGLAERAAQIGGRHLMNDPNWNQTVLKAVADPSTKLSVALDDVAGNSVYGRVMSAVQRSSAGKGSPFDWEMQQLYQGKRLASTDFYEGGKRLANPF